MHALAELQQVFGMWSGYVYTGPFTAVDFYSHLRTDYSVLVVDLRRCDACSGRVTAGIWYNGLVTASL